MDTFKTVWLFGLLLIFQPSLVRCQSFSPKHILTCLEIISKGIAELSKEVLPKAEELVTCTRFATQMDLADLDTKSFRSLVSTFLLKLVIGPSCLDTFSESMAELIKPHKAQFDLEKCAYFSVTPQCWPNSK